jgi:TldD protein
MSMKQIADWALNTVTHRRAGYADVRIVDHRQRALATKNGKVGNANSTDSLGIGIRVLVNDAWGFASTDDLSRESVERTAVQALEIARASASVKEQPVRLAPEPAVKIEWATPCKIDPFSTSVEQNLDLLTRIDAELLSVKGVTLAESSMHLGRYEQWFYNTEGSDIHQTRVITGAGFSALAFQGNEIMKRSYPNSFGGQYQNKGYELVDELKLVENARRIGEEAVALHKADRCPEGKMTLVLDSSQLGLQIHESIGHPIELDRVLGYEANFAGMSFLTLDKLRSLRYGSDLVNVVADATEAHGPGLGTFAYDDEGVQAQCTPIITNGLFTGYISSRETAYAIGENRSNGTMRAEGWNRIPLVRMTNINSSRRKAADVRAAHRRHR